MADYLKFEGASYQLAVPGALLLRCADCGHSRRVAIAVYMEDVEKQRRLCQRCRMVLFPVLECHVELWAACEAVFDRDGEEMARRRTEGHPCEQHAADSFRTLRDELANHDPMLALAAGYIEQDEFGDRLARVAEVRPARPSETGERAMQLADLARARKRYRERKAARTTEARDIEDALKLMIDAWSIDIAAFVMMAELRALLDAEQRDVSAITDQGRRLAVFRSVRTGRIQLKEGEHLLDYASDDAAAMGVRESLAMSNKIDEYIKSRHPV